MHVYNNALQVPINMQDGGVTRSASAQENNDSMATRSLIAAGRVVYLSVPRAGNENAMSASNNALEASIGAQRFTKEGDVASSLSPLVNSRRSAKRVLCLPWVKLPRSCPPCIYYAIMSASKNTCLPMFSCSCAERATRQLLHLLESKPGD